MEDTFIIKPIQSSSNNLESQAQLEQQKAIARVIAGIRKSLDIETIFKTSITDVRQLLNADRVVVFRFFPNLGWEGEFLFEDVAPEWKSIIAEGAHAHCFGVRFAELYQQGRINVISDIYQQDFSDCYVQILQRFQVRAYIIVPLLKGEQLWGLLCIHQCSSPRHWQNAEIEFASQIAEYLEVALQKADYLEQIKAQSAQLAQVAARERTAQWQKIAAITIEKIRQSLDLETIFRTTTQELRQLLTADRVGIYRFNPDWSGEFVFESAAEGWIPLIQAQLQQPEIRRNISECSAKDLARPPVVDTYLQDTQGGRFTKGELYRICDNIHNAGFNDCYLQVLEAYQAKAYVIIAIYHHQKLWGLLAVYQNSKPRKWEEDEIYLLLQISTQLGVALQHAELLEQTQRQKEELAHTLKELQQTQAQLIQSEKMAGLGQLVAGVAHEINNPVNFIVGNISYVAEYTENLLKMLHLYQQHYPNPIPEIQEQGAAMEIDYIAEDLPTTLNSMMLGAERICELVLSLRTFSRLDHAEIKSVDIHEGIDSTLLILQHRLKNHADTADIEILKEYGELPLVECHAAQLNQVFMNILSNAIDALEEGLGTRDWGLGRAFPDTQSPVPNHQYPTPQIQIRTELTSDNSIVIRIQDNGPGIPEQVRSRIFDPFFTTKEPGKGTGLGLSISYQIIVEKHGGQIKCFSEPGKGSEFWIEIPIARSFCALI
ncbi:GAF domain-containing protein [Chlorogloeopsis fritschii PCC 9212]|uniref:histidine kinase n=1 Tax=Chlorogloeopsis fritschii PCC 6912 TaxID=211165 RepID=A0A3S0ZW56_CHLFR|nr:GAF domain-containing protein [Chlorogloeopsis fritschii]RUR84952.1 hypothetical protein PCC6912_10680 [Chlorogloeopsis fritschii PCC 6912]